MAFAGHARFVFDLRSQTLRDLLLLSLIGLIAYLPGLASISPIDRDESRYMQATVQMIETGDLVDIRFQDQARHKKPAGAYWAQMASLGVTGQIDDVKRGERAIWAHRLPSVIGALVAIWATYLTGTALFGRREAFIGAGLLAVSVSLVFEAHIAKTDAMLAGAAALLLYGIATHRAWPSWLALAVGTLIKGPILLGIGGLALVVDGLLNRSFARLKMLLKPLPILVALLIAVPWFVAIGMKTDGAFFAEALGRDFGGKIAGAQETHGGWPGYYLLTSLIMFWPGILALPVAALWAWRNRQQSAVRLLLAWLIPMWVILEFVPTKLPHYTLPLYPALALLVGAGWVRLTDAKIFRLSGAILMGLFGGLLCIVVAGSLVETLTPVAVTMIGIGFVALSLTALLSLWKGEDRRGLLFAALFLGIGFGGALAQSSFFNLTPRLTAELASDRRVVSPDYREPSLVFLAGTDTQLTRDALPGDVLVLGQSTDAPSCANVGPSVSGLNYAKGDQLSLTIYETDACSAAELTAWAAAGKD